MALFDNSDINTVELRMVFNKLARLNSTSIVKQRDAFVDAILGKRVQGNGPADSVRYENEKEISGKEIEEPILASHRSWTGVTDGADERSAIAVNELTGWGAMVFAPAHLIDPIPIEDSKLDRFRNKELKAEDFIQEVFDQAMASYANTWQTHVHATGAGVGPSRTRIGSWVHTVSDGVVAATTESNYATYGKIDRTAAGNADFKSTVYDINGALTVSAIGAAMTKIYANDGIPNLAVCGETVYNRVRTLLESNLEAQVRDAVVEFSGPYIRYAGVNFALAAKCPAQTMGIFDTRDWKVYRKDAPLFEEITRDVTKKGMHVMFGKSWAQITCRAPNRQTKLVRITG
jgi:hypothetical protein